MSRVTESPSGEPDERVPDGLPIGEVAIAKPTKADQIAERCRSDHYLYNHGAAPTSLAAAALPHGVGCERPRRRPESLCWAFGVAVRLGILPACPLLPSAPPLSHF
jgi:hypothetical protein